MEGHALNCLMHTDGHRMNLTMPLPEECTNIMETDEEKTFKLLRQLPYQVMLDILVSPAAQQLVHDQEKYEKLYSSNGWTRGEFSLADMKQSKKRTIMT